MTNNSGIHIKAKNKGKFTKKAKSAGMSVQAFAKHVKAHPEKYSGKTRQEANFAHNVKTKFKHQTGGPGLADLGQSGPQSVAGQFPSIDPNYDPMDQIGPHVEDQTGSPLIDAPKPGSFMNTQAGQRMQTRASLTNPYVKDFNMGASAATDIGNAITGSKLKRQEYLQTVKSMTPKFMTNTNQGGLNNSPAYTMYGGDDRSFATMELGGEYDFMMVGGQAPGQHDYSNQTAEDRMYEGFAHRAFYGDQSIYEAGGSVTSSKAKEILRDGTVHGQPLSDKQKRYFGWIAGGKKMMGGYQTGGQTQSAPQQQSATPTPYNPTQYNPNNGLDVEHGANATLYYYKNKLNEALKAKNPNGYSDYFKGLQSARKAGTGDQYIQSSKFNDYLSPDDVKKTLGDKDYQNYLNSLKTVNQYNISKKQQPLYGNIEGESDDPSKLNYGRRFASLQQDPNMSVGKKDANGNPVPNDSYQRNYQYDPKTGQIVIEEKGDMQLRPSEFEAPAQDNNSTTSRQYGGPRDIRNERESFSYYRGAQNGGYAVGDEVELSTAEIANLKKQGYKFKMVK